MGHFFAKSYYDRHRSINGETAEGIGKHLGYPLPTVYKYLRELEAARAVESEAKGNTRVYFAGDFKLEVSPQKLMEAFEEQTITDIYSI